MGTTAPASLTPNWDLSCSGWYGRTEVDGERHVDVCCGQPVTERHRPDLVDAQLPIVDYDKSAKGLAYPGIPFCIQRKRGLDSTGSTRDRASAGSRGLLVSPRGHSTFLGLDIEARRAVVVLTNTGLNNVDYVAFHLLDPTVPLSEARQAEVVR